MAPKDPAVAYEDVGSNSESDPEPGQKGWPVSRRLIALITATFLVAAVSVGATRRGRAAHEDPGGPAAVSPFGPEDGLISFADDTLKNSDGNVELKHFGHMDCSAYPYLKIKKVKHDNLGGKGPDKGEHSLIYQMVVDGGKHDGIEFEVHFKLTSPEEDFKPQAPKEIGLQGRYGSINLKSGSSARILIQAFDPRTKKVIPFKSFFFTFFDLDSGKDGEATESIIIHHFAEAVISEHSQVKVEKLEKGGLKLTATQEGSGDDNPRDPEKLTKSQFQKAVTVWVKDQDHFEATFAVSPAKGKNPRWFNFRGQPSLLCAVLKDGRAPKLQEFRDPLGPKEAAAVKAAAEKAAAAKAAEEEKAAAAAKAEAEKARAKAKKAEEEEAAAKTAAEKELLAKKAAQAAKDAEAADKKEAEVAKAAKEAAEAAKNKKEEMELKAAAEKAEEGKKLTEALAKEAKESQKKAEEDAALAAEKKKSDSSSSHLGRLVILLTALLSSASLHRPAA